MKKRSYAIEFCVIFLLFVLPPLFVSAAPGFPRKAVYPLTVFLEALCMGCLLFVKKTRIQSSVNRFIQTSATLITFGTLTLTASCLQLIFQNIAPESALLAPETPYEWGNCIAGTIVAAFFEETLFRWYLPATLKLLLTQKLHAVAECLVILLFALSHRYLGIAGITNALLAGIILRWCTVKTGSIKCSWCAHTAYNALMLTFTFLL